MMKGRTWLKIEGKQTNKQTKQLKQTILHDVYSRDNLWYLFVIPRALKQKGFCDKNFQFPVNRDNFRDLPPSSSLIRNSPRWINLHPR